jgi:type IV secretion system protein TrbL
VIALGGILSGIFGGVAGDILNVIAGALEAALNSMITALTTFWVDIGTPNLMTTAGGSTPTDAVSYLQSHLQWYMMVAAVTSIVLGCIRMAWEQHHGAGVQMLKGLLIFLAVNGAGLTVISLLVSASDSFSTWIVNGALTGTGGGAAAGSFATAMGAMIGVSSAVTGGVPVMLIIVLGAIAVVASLIQVFLMIVRGGMLVILAGVLPLTFSFWTTEAGRQWSKKATAWLIAFTLYKPAASIVYATAFRLVSAHAFGSGGILSIVTGLTLLFVALLALPALMRFVAPMVGAAVGGGGGVMAGAMGAAAMMAIPTGAIAVGATAATAGATGATGASGAAGLSGRGMRAAAGAAAGRGAGNSVVQDTEEGS